MPTKIFYQRNRETLLKMKKDFYENDKELIKEQARIKYQSLSFKKKIKEMNMQNIGIINYPMIKKYKKRVWKKQTSQYD